MSAPTATTCPSVAEPAEPGHVRAQDPRAGVPRVPVDRRADRRSLPRAGRALHRHLALKWFTFTNGAHIDSLDPATAVRWYDFLSLFVGPRLPDLTPSLRALAPLLYQTAMGISGVTFPADPIENEPDYASALAAFESHGAGPDPVRQRRRRLDAGRAVAGFEQSFSRFPLPGTAAKRVVPRLGWRLTERLPPGSGGTDVFNWSPQGSAAHRLHRQHRPRRPVGHHAELSTGPRIRRGPRSRM